MAIQFGRYHRIQDTATYILYWYFAIGLLCAICVILFSFTVIHSRKATVVNRAICIIYISIYLLHPVVDSFFDMYEIRSRLSEVLLKISSGVAEEILYMICIIFIVVGIWLVISCVLCGCKRTIARVVSGKAFKWGNEGIAFLIHQVFLDCHIIYFWDRWDPFDCQIIVHNKILSVQMYGEFKELFRDNAVEYFVS